MKKGFTLVELLVVIVIIGILAAVIFVALDPAQRFGDARNARRWQEVRSVLQAVIKFQVDSGGTLPSALNSATAGNYYVLGTAGSGCNTTCSAQTTQAACLNMTSDLVDAYLSSIPYDPSTGSAANTDYYISKSANGRVTVGACDPENSATISVSR